MTPLNRLNALAPNKPGAGTAGGGLAIADVLADRTVVVAPAARAGTCCDNRLLRTLDGSGKLVQPSPCDRALIGSAPRPNPQDPSSGGGAENVAASASSAPASASRRSGPSASRTRASCFTAT